MMNRQALLYAVGAAVALSLACEAALPVAPVPLEKGELVWAKSEMVVSQAQYRGKECEQGLTSKDLPCDGVHLKGSSYRHYARFISEELLRVPGLSGESEYSGTIRRVRYDGRPVPPAAATCAIDLSVAKGVTGRCVYDDFEVETLGYEKTGMFFSTAPDDAAFDGRVRFSATTCC